MDTPRKTPFSMAQPGSFIDKNALFWGFFLIGVVIGFVAVYVVVAQPMFAQINRLERQLALVEDDLQTLVGERSQAWEAGTLLSDLTALKNQLHDARATVREVRNLRQDLLEESRHTSAAAEALSGLTHLQNFALEQKDMTAPASQTLEDMADIQKRLVDEHAATPKADETLADLERVRKDLGALLDLKSQIAGGSEGLSIAKSAATELLELKSQIAGTAADLPDAKAAASELSSLKDQLVIGGRDALIAHNHAQDLFQLKDELTENRQGLPEAAASLSQLVQMKDKLAEQTPTVADAVQNLEILSDFQEELAEHIRSLGRMREGLLQIVLMESTMGRVAKILEPLSQIANVRRLGDQELREAARSILQNRSTRITSKPTAPRDLSRDAASDPFDHKLDTTAETLDVEDLREVPPPVPLPVTTN